MLIPVPALTALFPASTRRIDSSAAATSDDRFATVSLQTFPFSRNDRRSRVVSLNVLNPVLTGVSIRCPVD